MKWKPFLYLLFGSLMGEACSSGEVDPSAGSQPPIAFRSPQMTRAAITTADRMDAFSVWGWYVKNSTIYDVFDATTVSRSGTDWGYEGIRYWMSGGVYDFYAVYPVGWGQYDAEGELTLTGFNCSLTGVDAVDLMTASRLDLSGDAPQTVVLPFKHELARLKFTVVSESSVVEISSLKLEGIRFKGDLFKNSMGTEWRNVEVCEQTDEYFKSAAFTLNTENGFSRDVWGDVLLIPHDAEQLADAKLYVTYRYPGETNNRTITIDLKTAQTPEWIAGKSYSYTLTLKSADLIVNVSVNDWTEENTSVSWGN